MSESTDRADAGPNDDPALMTRIDGEEVRLLVHIEPVERAADGATEPNAPPHASPSDPPGLAE